MSRVLLVAWREFKATVFTKGFLLGFVIVPLISLLTIPAVIALVLSAKPPKVAGSVAVIDRSGRVSEALRQSLGQDGLRERRTRTAERVRETLAEGQEWLGLSEEGAGEAIAQGLKAALANLPDLTLELLPADADVEREKRKVAGDPRAGGRLALVVVPIDAVEPKGAAEPFGDVELFVRPKLDDRVVGVDIRQGVEEGVLHVRAQAAGLKPADLERLVDVAVKTREVTPQGERVSAQGVLMFIPFAFVLLLMASTLVGGQYLLTTTVEEKSSRVVELLLSAVSPMQLMTGKILGQMAVGLLLMLLYGGLGTGALVALSLRDLLPPSSLIYLPLFFFVAYFMVASALGAIGSAVNDMREAQALQTPVVLLLLVPYVLWLPVSRDPNSAMAVALSLIPPISPFIMVARVASTEPPPHWQVWLSLLLSGAAGAAMLWAAAKVFRIGLLMHGTPPSLRTLWRWIRMA